MNKFVKACKQAFDGGQSHLQGDDTPPELLWAEISRLQPLVFGPGGKAWQDHAVEQKTRAIRAEQEVLDLQQQIKALTK